VIQKIAIGGTHIWGAFRRPFSGALSSLHINPAFRDAPLRPAVPLRFTAGSIPARLRRSLSIRPGAQRRRRAGLKPRVKRSGTRGALATGMTARGK
jgi:hypothetical protein